MMPKGPSGRPGSFGATNGHMIFAKTKNPDAARKFVLFLHSEENLVAWSKGTGWLPPLRKAADAPELKNSPGLQAMLAQLKAGGVVRTGYEYGAHPANGRVEGKQYFAELLQEVAINKKPVEEVMAKYQKALEQEYGG